MITSEKLNSEEMELKEAMEGKTGNKELADVLDSIRKSLAEYKRKGGTEKEKIVSFCIENGIEGDLSTEQINLIINFIDEEWKKI